MIKLENKQKKSPKEGRVAADKNEEKGRQEKHSLFVSTA
jgi:hypothetical protein